MAAEPREFEGLLARANGVRKHDWPVDWARSGESGGREFWMVANGAGAVRAAAAAEAGCKECHPEAIVSMGFCGALDPALGIGDVFVAASVRRGAGEGQVSPAVVPAAADPKRTGVLASIDHVAQTAAEKSTLRALGAAAVEMEAAGVAETAARHAIPFFCIKSVTDTADQSFVTDFNGALLSSGHFGTIRILASALTNPGKAFPELIRLRHSCRIATHTLGEFIDGCRF